MPITITSKKHLFRRCGLAHPKEGTEYPDGRFTTAELAVLRAEAMLTVTITEGGSVDKPMHAKELIKAIGEAESVEAVDALVPDAEERTTVLAAADKRRQELAEGDD